MYLQNYYVWFQDHHPPESNAEQKDKKYGSLTKYEIFVYNKEI
jgi:hypothetical protein